MTIRRTLAGLLLLLVALGCGDAFALGRAERAAARVRPALERDLAAQNLQFGAPVLLRLFKLERELEVWVRGGDTRFALFRTYPICTFSGTLGPKQKVGDLQAPEGFYTVARGQLNPASSYHLSFNLGYPNAFDRAHGRTGSLLMVHGNCVSIGCYAMGDEAIEDIYTLLDAALAGGQTAAQVHAFPFRFDRSDVDARLADPQWGGFWADLRSGWDAFEQTRHAPQIKVRDKRYVVTATP